MVPIALALALLVGLALGAFGGGGGTLLLPVLLYVLHMGMHEAVPASLIVIGLTSLLALVPVARAGQVSWRHGLLFGLASVATAFTAGRLAHLVPAGVLSLGFTAILGATAASMRARARASAADPADDATLGTSLGTKEGATASAALRIQAQPIGVVVAGATVGALTGLLGVGGGFLAVPALVIFAGLALPQAIATSLLVIVLNSAAAAAGHLGHLSLSPDLLVILGGLSVASVLGAVLGRRLADRLPRQRLTELFADFVAAMAVFMFSQEVGRVAVDALWLRSQVPGNASVSSASVAAISLGLAVVALVALRCSSTRTRGGGTVPASRPSLTSTGLHVDRAVVSV